MNRSLNYTFTIERVSLDLLAHLLNVRTDDEEILKEIYPASTNSFMRLVVNLIKKYLTILIAIKRGKTTSLDIIVSEIERWDLISSEKIIRNRILLPIHWIFILFVLIINVSLNTSKLDFIELVLRIQQVVARLHRFYQYSHISWLSKTRYAPLYPSILNSLINFLELIFIFLFRFPRKKHLTRVQCCLSVKLNEGCLILITTIGFVQFVSYFLKIILFLKMFVLLYTSLELISMRFNLFNQIVDDLLLISALLLVRHILQH